MREQRFLLGRAAARLRGRTGLVEAVPAPALWDAGLYCRTDDRGDPVLQFAPPLVAGDRELDELESIVRRLLLEASADRQPARAELLRHVTKRFPGLVEAHVVPPSPSLAKHYGTDSRDRLFLLRPDGYVGFRCLASEAPQLEAYLADLVSV